MMRSIGGWTAAAMLVGGSLILGPSTSGAPAMTTGPAVKTTIQGWRTTSTTVPPGTGLRDRVRVKQASGGPSRRLVVIQRSRAGAQQWRRIGLRRTDRGGRLVVRFRVPRDGSWDYRLRVRAEPGATSARTRARRIVVAGAPTDPTPVPTVPSVPSGSPGGTATPGETVFAVGDIGDCNGSPESTARLIARGAPLLVPGDVAYPVGSPANFTDCYDPSYGKFLEQTFPVPGNHDYATPGAAGYFGYFAGRAGTAAAPWYRVDIGQWRIFLLDSNCDRIGGCRAGSREYEWLREQLKQPSPMCTAAVWHHPRWSSGYHGPSDVTGDMYRLLDERGADLLITGHEHSYERFAPQSWRGSRDIDGVRQFVVGTGGVGLRGFAATATGSQVRISSHGVLRLQLRSGDYSWEFIGTDASVLDSGTAACR